MSDKLDPKNWIFMSQRQRMSPFPNYLSMESVCVEMEDFVGEKLDGVLLFFEKNIMNAFPEIKSYERVGKALVEKIYQNPNLCADLVKKQEQLGFELVDYSKKIGKQVDNKTSNQELLEMYLRYAKGYKQIYACYGWIWSAEDFFIKKLLELVETKVKGDSVKAMDILNTLTRQPSAMVATVERHARLKLAVRISEHSDWNKFVIDKNLEKIKEVAELDDLIKKHVDNYFWVTRDYEDPILDFNQVVDRLGKNLQENTIKKLENLGQDLRQHEQKRRAYLKDLAFDQQERALFEAMRNVAHLKELRKRYVSESGYYFDSVLEQIAKRLYLSLQQVRMMTPEDLDRSLFKGEDLSDELNHRYQLSLWHCNQGVTEVITGQQAEELYGQMCQVDKNAKEFIGMPVSPGVARGPVKIIMNPDECDKVKKGDIILSVQVVPSFSTALIKAGGLVCDGGHGITSHPATLAREAGIPGVIQTRYAREVFKDGDMVEVDGYKGTVKLLN
ncbi:MAG: PEP-utilizing enzyme [bacterium]